MMDFGLGLGVIRSSSGEEEEEEEETIINVAQWPFGFITFTHVPKVIAAMATTRVYGSHPALFISIKTVGIRAHVQYK